MSVCYGCNPPGPMNADRFFWGVDSVTAPTDTVSDGRTTFLQYITNLAGMRPIFWGRYLSRQGAGNLATLDRDALLQNNVRILLIYAGIRCDASGVCDNQYESQGKQKAQDAITQAMSLGAPSGVYIYLNAEPPPTRAFYKGWFDTILGSGYFAGVYGRPPAIVTEYCAAFNGAARDSMQNGRALAWFSRWPAGDCPNRAQGFGLPQNRSRYMVPPTRICTGFELFQYQGNCCIQPSAGGPVANCTQGVEPIGPPPSQEIDMDIINYFGFKSLWAPARTGPAFMSRSVAGTAQSTLDWKWVWNGNGMDGPEGPYPSPCPGKWRCFSNWGLGQTSDPSAAPGDCPATPRLGNWPRASGSWTPQTAFTLPTGATITGIEVVASSNYVPRAFGPYLRVANHIGTTCADWVWSDRNDSVIIPGLNARIVISSAGTSASKPLQAGTKVYGSPTDTWGLAAASPTYINSGITVSIDIPNPQWQSDGNQFNGMAADGWCQCPGSSTPCACPFGKPADIGTMDMGLAAYGVRVYYTM